MQRPKHLHLQYISADASIQRITNHRIYTTPAHVTRTTLTYFNEWTETTVKQRGLPLIENTTTQTLPTHHWLISSQVQTWEQAQHALWDSYHLKLKVYTTLSRYPLLDLMSVDTIWIVSDGGKGDAIGYYGWVVATGTNIIYEGEGHVPGNPLHLDSLRAESMGMLHALSVIGPLLAKIQYTGTVILASDNLELIKRTTQIHDYGTRLPNQYDKPHMDIQCSIDVLLLRYFPTITINHVRGHQDEKKNSTLTWLEHLNVRADTIATKARYNHPTLPVS